MSGRIYSVNTHEQSKPIKNPFENIIDIGYAERNFWLAFDGFLDIFYHSSKENKPKLIVRAPDYDKYIAIRDKYDGAVDYTIGSYYNVPLNRQFVYIVSAVHKLANDHNIRVPKWVYNDRYKLDTPFYFNNTQNIEFQAYLRQHSPVEFRQRNLFVCENILDRV